MIPVPGPVAPPMVWSPTPWPRIFHFHGIYSMLDAKPHISVVFAPVWMVSLIYIYIYIGTKEYSYITSWLPILPTGPTHLPHPQGGGGNHDHGGGDYIHPTPIHRGKGGNHDYLYYLQDHIHRGEEGNHDRGGTTYRTHPTPTSTGGRGEPWPSGGRGGRRTWNIYIYIIYI